MSRVSSFATKVGASAAIAALLWGSSARADAPAVTYTITNLDGFPDRVFVAWPRTCGSTGDPLGAVSLKLNPDWATRQHEVDYEVLKQGAVHQVATYCLATTRIYALRATEFPRATRVATADDVSLGKKPGETLDILPALDAVELTKRIAFFGDTGRNVVASIRFDRLLQLAPVGSPPIPAKVAHFDLRLEADYAATPPTFTAFSGDTKITFDPPAGDAGPDAGSTANDAGAVDAGPIAAPSPPAPAPAPAPATDGGTRWVYAAAIGGLIAGGLIAQYRKKKDAK